jgi:hypothetical protein
MLLNRGLGQPLATLVGHPGGPAAGAASDPSADWPTPVSASLLGDQLEARRAELRATLPIRRAVGPGDAGALAVHMMTDTALTGATYDVDRGQQLLSNRGGTR